MSNLSFVSKLVERVAVKQLMDYLETNGLLPSLQSAYRRHHSTETALLKVLSDILMATDGKRVTLLALLDLSAAFDCVDHDILLHRLQSKFGLDGAVLSWIRSFLSDKTQCVCFGDCLSSEILYYSTAFLGDQSLVPCYMAEVFDIIASLGLTGHSYADDTQQASALSAECIEHLDRWMGQNRLKLNAEKTQLLWLELGSSWPS